MKPLLKKYISESWLLFVGLAIGVMLFGWLRVWIVGELDTAKFRQIIDLLPNDWRKLAPVDTEWLVSYLGRTSTTFDEPMLITLILGWCVIRGSDVVSGELSRGTMEMLLAQPMSRRQLYWHHAMYTITFLIGLCLLFWFGMSLGIWTSSVEETAYPEFRIPIVDYRIPLSFLPARTETIAMATEVNPLMFLPGLLNLFGIGVFFAGLSACISAYDRYRWRTIGVMVGIYFLSFGMKVVGMSSERFSWAENFSIFGLYHPASAIHALELNPSSAFSLISVDEAGKFDGSGTLTNFLLPILIGAVLFHIGMRRFQSRDLPAPV